MTLILSIQTSQSIWLLADQRLSSGAGAANEGAVKAAMLSTPDGDAIIGYAGLGVTAKGTQPSDWIANVLRGQNISLEESIILLGDALKTEFPNHLGMINFEEQRKHVFVVTAILDRDGSRLFRITLDGSTGDYIRSFESDIRSKSKFGFDYRTPFCIAGSGARVLERNQEWKRQLLQLVRSYNQRRISAAPVNKFLAELCLKVHKECHDRSVGPNCLIARRSKRGSPNHAECAVYHSGKRYGTAIVPSICNGDDFGWFGKMVSHVVRDGMKDAKPNDPEGWKKGHQSIFEEIKRTLSYQPTKPNKKLR